MRYSSRSWARAVLLGDQGSCERWAPALFEDGELDALDAAVAVGAPGADEALSATQAPDGRAEVLGAELRAVIGGDLSQPPAHGGEF
jgi:hypothetical protein